MSKGQGIIPAGSSERRDRPLEKQATGIRGFDDISAGGIPKNRVTTVLGGPGAGKTVFALQTVVNQVLNSGEAGIFVTLEESVATIQRNMRSFDWAVGDLDDSGLTFLEAKIPSDAIVGGAFDLHGVLTGLTALQKEVGATTIVFDGLDMLLGSLQDEALERKELSRLNDWVRQSDISAIITAKASGYGGRDQSRLDFLQYMTDCVIVLSGSFTETTSSRSLRITKYRGSGFAANPVPFVIGKSGLDVLALKGVRSEYPTFTERVSTGIPRLDSLLCGGYIRGSCILISGSPGTSKTSLGANFAAAFCSMNEKALIVSFDESGSQIAANMRSIGLDLAPFIESGHLIMASLLSNGRSPEEHFVAIRELIELHAPRCLVIDPLSALLKTTYPFTEVISEALIDMAKSFGITILCTSLLGGASGEMELSASHVSTIADTWIHVSYVAEAGERNRALTIIKSRGTGHSNQVRELLLNESGVHLEDVYVAEGRVLMGSARAQKEAEAARLRALDQLKHEQLRRDLEHEITGIVASSKSLERELESKRQQAAFLDKTERLRIEQEDSAALHRIALRKPDEDEHDAPSGAGG